MLTQSARASTRIATSTPIFLSVKNGVKATRAFSSQPLLLSDLQVGDRVLLRWRAGKIIKHKLTKPLRENSETFVDNHVIQHKDLLGKPSNTRVVNTSKDGLRKLHVTARHPTLDEFTSLSPRRVAPIYATYGSTIISLLDIHPEPPNPEDPPTPTTPTLQILEAGTGHGSLTLHLSRLIAPSNPPLPPSIKPIPSQTAIYLAGEESADPITPDSPALQQWRATRRAIVHTIDIDPLNRVHADQLIRSYRAGLYWPHINFHVANVKHWIRDHLSSQQPPDTPFLDVAMLDMPDVETYIKHVAPALKEGGSLLVFAPQITQIAGCVMEVVTRKLGVKLERVVELGEGISTGRMWDVRMASLKNPGGAGEKVSKRGKKDVVGADGVESRDGDGDGGEVALEGSVSGSDAGAGAEPVVGTIPPMVCRPIVGEMTRGGGFVGLWKKVGTWEDGKTDS